MPSASEVGARPRVLLACNPHVRERYLDPADLERLERFADWDWFSCEGGGIYDTNADPQTTAELAKRLSRVEGLVVCHGCPTITAALLDQVPQLRFIGELEGDRFASRIEVEAAWARQIRTVDTTNGS